MLIDCCRAQADTVAGDVVPTDLSTLGKGKGEKNGKGKANAKTTKHFLRYSLVCKAWEAREEGLLVECQEREGHCISGDPTTPAPNTTEPPITGKLLQSDEGAAQWLYSLTKREPSREEFLIDSGAATSVCQQSLADSLGGKPNRLGVELGSATGHQFTTTANATICIRTETVSMLRATFRLRPRILYCGDLSCRLDKCATEAISSKVLIGFEQDTAGAAEVQLQWKNTS